jgi:hypothetical protein
MTPEAQRIALAEWEGYCIDKNDDPAYPWIVITPHGYSSGSRWATEDGAWSHAGPRYLNDLNAVAVLQERLTPEQWMEYCERLFDITGTETPNDNPNLRYGSFRWLVSATSAQRCEALLRTLNLWKDDA